MGSSRRPRDRKVQIAVAALRLFHEFGYSGVGVDTVAAQAGIGGSAVYRHYRSKQDLLAAVVLDGLARVENAMDEATRQRHAGDDLLGGLAAVALTERRLPVLWQRDVRHLTESDRAEVATRTSALHVRVATILGAGFPAPPPEACLLRAQAVMSVMWSPSYHHASLPRADFEKLLVTMATAVRQAPVPDSLVPPAASTSGGDDRRRPVRASRREMILATASELFAERGFAAVSLEEVGAALGVSGASVYRHFATKVEVLHTALTRAAEALHLSLSQALSAAPTTDEALERVLESYVDVMLSHRDITQLLVTEVINLPDRVRAGIRRTQLDYVAEWVRLVRALRPGLTRDAARIVVHGSLTVINDLLRSERHRGRPTLREDVISLGLTVLRAG